MSNTPYPGFPPNFKIIDEINGLSRQCFVVEIRSRDQLSQEHIAMIKEQVEGTINKLKSKITTIENMELVYQDRFDRVLTDGLRLSNKS